MMAFMRPRLTSFWPTYWKVVFMFRSLPLSCQEVLPFSLFIFLYLFFTPPSIYPIIIVTWIFSDREELSLENQTPAAKETQRKRNFILIPTVHFISLNKLPPYVSVGVFSHLYEKYQHDLQNVKGACEVKMSLPIFYVRRNDTKIASV